MQDFIRCLLEAIHSNLHNLNRVHAHHFAVGADFEISETPGLPPQHLVRHALERFADHDQLAAGFVARGKVNVGQPPLPAATAPLDRGHHQVKRMPRLHFGQPPLLLGCAEGKQMVQHPALGLH